MSWSAVCQRKVCSGAAEFESIAVKFFRGNYTSNVGSRVERSIQAPPSSSYPAPACCCLMFAIISTLLLTHTNTHTRTHTHTRAHAHQTTWQKICGGIGSNMKITHVLFWSVKDIFLSYKRFFIFQALRRRGRKGRVRSC